MMKAAEAVRRIRESRQEKHRFVRWWRKRDDFVDFATIDRFLAEVGADTELDGFELLDMEEMWRVFTELNTDNLSREKTAEGETIRWVWTDKEGVVRVRRIPLTPEGLISLMDTELFD